jgi:hypothetical protein
MRSYCSLSFCLCPLKPGPLAAPPRKSPREIFEDQNMLALEDTAHGVLALIPEFGELSRREVPLKQTLARDFAGLPYSPEFWSDIAIP